jgi:Protein of unknown function DUF262/Protein of unknown function (DUF1524)
MSPLEQIQINLGGIGKGIADGNLVVPPYQRSYAWEEQHVRELFQDIGTAITENEQEYFLGTIVLIHGGHDQLEVVDGQQRLATTMILMAAIRDHFATVSDADRAADIEREFLVTRDLRTQERLPKLQLNEADHDFFLKRVLEPVGSPARDIEPSKDSHSRIATAAQLAKAHVKRLVELHSKPADHLVDWVEFMKANARVIWVRVPDDANAFTIFETLNDRGLVLAISDLLKNYLFSRAENRIAEVQQRWISMLGTLEAVASEAILVTYIRHLWSSKYGLTREKDLYNEIKGTVTSKQGALDLANELSDSAVTYAAILNPNHELWTNFGATARSHMATLNLLGMVQLRPLLLATLEKFPEAEVRKAMRHLVSWAVRFLITGRLGTGPLEQHYSQRAKEVRQGKLSNAKALLAAMKAVVPDDGEFKEAFRTASVSKAHLARYYLNALERQARGEASPELVPNPNEEEVNLEHILPLSPSAEWEHILPDVARANAKRLGNLVLLRASANSAAANAGFGMKRAILKASEFKLTSHVAKNTDWGPAQIDKRQQQLADLALIVWPIKG